MFQIASFKIICTDSTEILFSKLRSAGLNYHLPKRKFFTFPYCAEVSNKHCLLTFFHFTCVALVKADLVVGPFRPSVCLSVRLPVLPFVCPYSVRNTFAVPSLCNL